MKQLLFYSFFCITLLLSCNNNQSTTKNIPSNNDSATGMQTLINNGKDTNLNKLNTDENDDELKNILNQFTEEYKKNYNLDSNFTIGNDSFKLVFKYTCLFDSNLHVPKKYVAIYGLKEFVTHNFESSIRIYKNKTIIVEKKITKDSFSGLLDNNLNLYGALLYPEVQIGKTPIVKIDYSISIPLTDVGKSVSILVDESGNVSIE